MDTGFHPEYATPECDDLLDLVACDRAGERHLEDLVRRADAPAAGARVTGRIQAFKNNTDSAGNSYGCHENYLVSRDTSFPRLVEALIPFLVSRQIFVGRRQDPARPARCRYRLSQRADHIVDEVSGTTVSGRPMINTRDEPHADRGRFRRLHVIVGDSNMSEVATYLKVGTTALVLDMIEDGFFDRDRRARGQRVTPCVPSRTIRRFANGCASRMVAPTRPSRSSSFTSRRARPTSAASVGTRRSRAVLARWSDVLARLAQDPLAAHREVDWAIKGALIDRYLAKHGCSLEDPRVGLLDLQYHDIGTGPGPLPPPGPARRSRDPGSDEVVERAQHRPPQTTRARLRGDFVRRANLRGCEYQVDWAYVRTAGARQRDVLCPDPFIAHDERVERLAA